MERAPSNKGMHRSAQRQPPMNASYPARPVMPDVRPPDGVASRDTMTEQEEEYVHFVSCINDLNIAWRLLQEIKQCKGNILVGAAFQFALIEYSKPYKASFGILRNSTGKLIPRKLDESHVPAMHIQLHKRIIDARDRIHAHSDLTVMEAKVYVKNSPHGKIVGTLQNKIYGTEELSNIDAIIDLIEQTLDSMYVEVKRLEAALPVN